MWCTAVPWRGSRRYWREWLHWKVSWHPVWKKTNEKNINEFYSSVYNRTIPSDGRKILRKGLLLDSHYIFACLLAAHAAIHLFVPMEHWFAWQNCDVIFWPPLPILFPPPSPLSFSTSPSLSLLLRSAQSPYKHCLTLRQLLWAQLTTSQQNTPYPWLIVSAHFVCRAAATNYCTIWNNYSYHIELKLKKRKMFYYHQSVCFIRVAAECLVDRNWNINAFK